MTANLISLKLDPFNCPILKTLNKMLRQNKQNKSMWIAVARVRIHQEQHVYFTES